MDARRDVFRDIFAEEPSDVPLVLDAGPPFVGNWVPLPGAPNGCGARMTLSPGSDVGPLKWLDCTSLRPGCKRLDADWSNEVGSKLGVGRGGMREAGGTLWLSYERAYPKTNAPYNADAVISAVGPATGAPIFAAGDFIEPSPCEAFANTQGTDIVALVLGTGALDGTIFFASSKVTSPFALTWATHGPKDFGLLDSGGPQGSRLGATRVFFDTFNPYTTAIFDFAKDKPIVPKPLIPGSLPIPVHGGAFVEGTSGLQSILFVGNDGNSTKIYPASLSSQVFALDADSSDNDAPVWLEGDVGGSEPSSIILRTAPYDASSLVPRNVAKIPKLKPLGGVKVVAHAGMALILEDKNMARLIRLSDGMGWQIPTEVEDGFSEPLWVDADEIWISTTSASQPDFITGIVRIARASLGPPTLASGF